MRLSSKYSRLTAFHDVLLHGQFWVENESKVSGRIGEGDVRANSNRIREGNGGRFQGRRKGKELLFCRRSVWVDFRSSMFLCRVCMHWVLWWGSLRGADFWSCVSSAKSWWFTEWLAMISERCSVQDEENEPQYWSLRHTVHELWWWRRRVFDWSGLVSVWEVWLEPLECSRLNAKNRDNNRLYTAPHLVRAQSAYKDTRIHSFHHTHTHTVQRNTTY